MNDNEYYRLQDELSKLILQERVHRKYPHSGYADAYKRAVLDCKSKLHAFYKHQNLPNEGAHL